MRNNQGFTIIELLITITIFAILVALVVSNLVYSQGESALDAVTQTFQTDLKNQQIKSMTGNNGTSSSSQSFGIYISTSTPVTSYKLFQGTPSDTNATTINIGPNVKITSITNEPVISSTAQILFNTNSGIISSFSSNIVIVFTDSVSGKTETVTILNKLGAINAVKS